MRSANAALLRVAGSRMGELGHEAVGIVDVTAAPPFDPALVDEAPSMVTKLQDQIRRCDSVVISAPEYAAGVAGSTKNTLDWLVGDATIHGKVIGIASAGTTGGPGAIEQLVRTVSWQGGWVVATLGVAAPRTKTDDLGEFTDMATLDLITTWVDTVVGAVDGTAADRASLVTSVVEPYGIDPARFGSFA